MFEFKPGDTVYAIVKNRSTFQPEVILATVVSACYAEVVLEHKASVSSLCSTTYTFPTDEWKMSVFHKMEDAEAMLFEPEGEPWRTAHGLASPLQKSAMY